MRRIKQKHETGCGIACIAILAGVPYQEVRSVAAEKLNLDDDEKLYTTSGQLKKLAECFGIYLGQRRRKFQDWDKLPDLAVVSINPDDDGKHWHWVVFERKRDTISVIDPKKSIKSNRRRDFKRMEAVGYLTVKIATT